MKLKNKLLKLRLLHTKAIWVDVDNNFKRSKSLNDDALKNILFIVANGGGNETFLTRKHINRLFEEAYTRKIMRFDFIFNLHTIALCRWCGDSDWPKFKVTPEGKYKSYEIPNKKEN